MIAQVYMLRFKSNGTPAGVYVSEAAMKKALARMTSRKRPKISEGDLLLEVWPLWGDDGPILKGTVTL